MFIQVKDYVSGIIYNNDMSQDEHCILSINFCTSYTQVEVQDKIEVDGQTKYPKHDIIISPLGSKPNFVDEIAIQNDHKGDWAYGI